MNAPLETGRTTAAAPWGSILEASSGDLTTQFLRGVGLGVGGLALGLWLVPLAFGALLVRGFGALIHPTAPGARLVPAKSPAVP